MMGQNPPRGHFQTWEKGIRYDERPLHLWLFTLCLIHVEGYSMARPDLNPTQRDYLKCTIVMFGPCLVAGWIASRFVSTVPHPAALAGAYIAFGLGLVPLTILRFTSGSLLKESLLVGIGLAFFGFGAVIVLRLQMLIILVPLILIGVAIAAAGEYYQKWRQRSSRRGDQSRRNN